MGRLDGKVVVLTGAASGMGAFEFGLFLEENAKVVATDINYDLLKEVAKEYKEFEDQMLIMKHDVTDPKSWEYVVKQSLGKFKKIDVLVNNAGIVISNNIIDLDYEDWQKVMTTNVDGVFLGMKYIIPQMVKEKGGSIINISSIYGEVGGSTSAAYNASKGAVKTLSRNAAVDFGHDNIRVNIVQPGLVETPMTKMQIEDPVRREFVESNILLPRLGSVEDVGYGVLYLASDESKFVTGSCLVIDGGYTAK